MPCSLVEDKPASSFVNLRVFQSNPQLAPLVQDVHFVPLQPPSGQQDYMASAIGPDDYSWVDKRTPTLAVKMLLTGLAFPDHVTPDHPFCKKLTTLQQAIQNNLDDLQRAGHPKWRDVNLSQQVTAWKRNACLQIPCRARSKWNVYIKTSIGWCMDTAASMLEQMQPERRKYSEEG